MPTIFRLQRGGRKNRSYFRIVVADSAFKRDGRFLEQVGTYNPLQQPAEVTIDDQSALSWLIKGAQPSPTVMSIFRRRGLLAKLQAVRLGKDPDSVQVEIKSEKVRKAVPSKKAQAKAAAGEGASA